MSNETSFRLGGSKSLIMISFKHSESGAKSRKMLIEITEHIERIPHFLLLE